ncbi:MAG: SH3 domain-containing protein [Nocardioides sp.]|nr:SH3 domain-containing protein [Nocardioides sp.]
MRSRRLVPVVVLACLALVGCSTDEPDARSGDEPSVSPSATPSEPAPEESPTASEDPEATPEETGSAPEEPAQARPAALGDLAVVGVDRDDVLNVRSGPGAGNPVVARLAPTATGFTATGRTRDHNGGARWTEVETGGTTGWVNARYLALIGETEDVTSMFPDPVRARTMGRLGVAMLDRLYPDPPRPSLVVVQGPERGDLTELVVDVIGIGDDSAIGWRWRLFAQSDGDRFVLRTVEETMLCSRDVTDEGLCL